MGGRRTSPSTFLSFGRNSARARTSSRVRACYVESIVGIYDCLHASRNRRTSWNCEGRSALRDFHFSSDDTHSEIMLSRKRQFHVQQNPLLIPTGFPERYLP